MRRLLRSRTETTYTQLGSDFLISIGEHGFFEGDAELLELLRYWRQARTGEDVQALFPNLDLETVDTLCEVGALIPADRESAPPAAPLEIGTLLPPAQPVGILQPIDELPPQEGDAWVVVGVQTDTLAAHPGTREGPSAIRAAFSGTGLSPAENPEEWEAEDYAKSRHYWDFEFRRSFDISNLRVFDVGDITLYGSDRDLSMLGSSVRATAAMLAQGGYRPLFFGGDHSISRYTLEGILQHHSELAIIHFDAHPDFDSNAVPKSHHHGNSFSYVLLDDKLRWMRQIGIRANTTLKWFSTPDPDPRLSWVSAREAMSMNPEEVFAGLDRSVPCYLSFDIDCLDPSVAPQTGTPLVGGLSFYKALELVDYVAEHFSLVGADFVEVSGGGASATTGAGPMAARFAARVLCSGLPFTDLPAVRVKERFQPL